MDFNSYILCTRRYLHKVIPQDIHMQHFWEKFLYPWQHMFESQHMGSEQGKDSDISLLYKSIE